MANLSAVKRHLKTAGQAVLGFGETGIGLGETVARRALGNEGVSKIGQRGIKRLDAVHKLLKKQK